MIDRGKLEQLSYSEKRELMLQISREEGVPAMSLQKEFGISLGGRKKGSKNLKTQVWEEATEKVLTDLLDDYLRILDEFAKSNDEKQNALFLVHYNNMLKYFKPQAPIDLNVIVQEKIRIAYDDSEIVEIEYLEEDRDDSGN